MRNNIAKLFKIQGLFIDGLKWEGKRKIIIKVRSPRTTALCNRCGTRSKKIHDYKTRRVFHGLFGDNQVYLDVTKRRFYCKGCIKPRPFTETFPTITKYHRRDMHADNELLESLKDRSFTAVAKDRKTSTSTVIRHCEEAVKAMPARWPTRGEIIIGIDGHSAKKKASARTILELRTHRTIAVLPTEKKKPWEDFIKKMPENVRNRVVEVCMDMESGGANAVRELIPHAKIVIDHFHVIQMANKTIDEVRRIVQDPKHPIPKKIWLKNKEKLKSEEFDKIVALSDRYPELFKLWVLKEDLRQVYEMHRRTIAAHRLKKVIEGYKKSKSGYAWVFSRTLERWFEEILNFFERRTTNAQVEGMHRKFKLIQRISYGFRTVDHYLMKVTIACVPLYLLTHPTIYN